MELWLGLSFVDAPDLVDVAQACEAAGIAGVSMPDHLVLPARVDSSYPYSDDGTVVWEPSTPWPDSWVAIGAMAGATTRLRLGTGVFVGPLRQPIVLAKAVSTAAALSHDRVVCGLGAGWMREEFEAVGEDFASRGRRLDELTVVLRRLWTGGMVEHSGPYYRFGPVQMVPAPAVPIPIWIGGNSPAAMRRAVSQDGWICAYHDVDQAIADLHTVLDLRRTTPAPGTAFATAVVGPVRQPAVLHRLADAGYDAVIVPIAMLTKGRRRADWLEATASAARLVVDAGIG
ncbi:MAG TPA: TIGR03619 family F420-dependent LLM class oxidoreductase [Acidimicrobiales bacterium]|nr:TIGR03619 family F420-dependent LLM class oxidoreductase [Acidimicrobiales bacterium]